MEHSPPVPIKLSLTKFLHNLALFRKAGGGSMASNVNSVKLEISVVLGRAEIPIQRLLRMGRGAVIELDTHQDDPVTILANDKAVAKGEILIQGDKIAVAVVDLLKTY